MGRWFEKFFFERVWARHINKNQAKRAKQKSGLKAGLGLIQVKHVPPELSLAP